MAEDKILIGTVSIKTFLPQINESVQDFLTYQIHESYLSFSLAGTEVGCLKNYSMTRV